VSVHPLTWLDVFTDRPLAGNGLAVVGDADAVDDATMLLFARETRLSETTFVQTATTDGAHYRNRIWTTVAEMPFAGHPSLGTAVAVARTRGAGEARYHQQTPAGVQPVDVRGEGDRWRASMLQEPARFGPQLDPADALGAVGLGSEAADADLPVQVVSTGVPHVIAPVRAAALAEVLPDAHRLRALLDPHAAIVLLVAVVEGDRAESRGFFLGVDGVVEDPATGSAAGPLMALTHARLGLERLTVRQGVEMGRPSRLDCAVEGDRVRVGGDVVVVADGTVRLPDLKR